MDISAALAADLAALTQALDDPNTALEAHLRALVADLKTAVASYLGMTMTITLNRHPVSFTVQDRVMSAATIATSLQLPLNAISAGEYGSNLVLYAAAPGAFVDLAADLSYALGLDPTALSLDAHLIAPARETGVTGLDTQSTINQALGVLIADGHTSETAQAELRRLADLDSGHLHYAAQAVLHSVTRRPNDGG